MTAQLDPNGPDLTLAEASEVLGFGERTMFRYLEDGLIPGAWQPKPHAPWRFTQKGLIDYFKAVRDNA